MNFVPKIAIAAAELVYSGWAKLTRYTLDIEKHGGGMLHVVREVHDHGHGVGVLPYDGARGTVLLVRQFRLPPYLSGADGMMVEACAGLLDADEAPEACALREAEEELGYRIHRLRSLGRVWATPGAVTESLWLFLADYSPADRIGKGGGADADEDVEVLEVSLEEATRLIATHEIADAKTIILLQHLWMTVKGG
ncbi:MAG: NUDIX domain-containing protein, partial [Parvibaculaceae bacterium]